MTLGVTPAVASRYWFPFATALELTFETSSGLSGYFELNNARPQRALKL